VSVRGGGVGFIAGEHAMPAKLRGTALEKLLPVQVDPAYVSRQNAAITEPFSPRLTAGGRRNPLLQFELDRSTDGSADGDIFARLPGLYWHARVTGALPGAETLVEHPTEAGPDGDTPLVVLGRYGSGRTFYQGSDDTWRWRQYKGEGFYDAYWVKI